MMLHKWLFEVNFIDWSQQNLDPLQFPLISWFEVTRNEETDVMEVVAKRIFEEGEAIGLFWVKILKENPNKVTQYAL
jgi:hypothetical protein